MLLVLQLISLDMQGKLAYFLRMILTYLVHGLAGDVLGHNVYCMSECIDPVHLLPAA